MQSVIVNDAVALTPPPAYPPWLSVTETLVSVVGMAVASAPPLPIRVVQVVPLIGFSSDVFEFPPVIVRSCKVREPVVPGAYTTRPASLASRVVGEVAASWVVKVLFQPPSSFNDLPVFSVGTSAVW